MKSLHNKTIIVVGASGDIGSDISCVFHEAGANVVLASRKEETLLEVQKRMGQERTLVVPTDANNPDAIAALFSKAKEVFGQIDAVIISVGCWDQVGLDDDIKHALAILDKHFETILRPLFIASGVAQQFFREQGHGLIVNMSSHVAIKHFLRGNGTYGPIKSGARWTMLALSDELKEKAPAVRAVDLMLAIVDTTKNQKHFETEEKRKGAVQTKDIAQWIIDHFDDPNIPDSVLLDSSTVIDP